MCLHSECVCILYAPFAYEPVNFNSLLLTMWLHSGPGGSTRISMFESDRPITQLHINPYPGLLLCNVLNVSIQLNSNQIELKFRLIVFELESYIAKQFYVSFLGKL